MSNKLFDSPYFLPLDSLMRFDASTSVADTFQQLSRAGRAGFALLKGQTPCFIKGDVFLEKLFDQQDAQAVRQRVAMPLSEAMRMVGAPETFCVAANTVTANTDPATLMEIQEEKAFLVKDGERPLGWFLNHPNLLNPATRRPRYICSNAHSNPDPDHGTCYSCPAKIVRVEFDTV